MSTLDYLQRDMGFDSLTARFAACILEDRVDLDLFTAYRKECRDRGDYQTADKIRDMLKAANVQLQDTKNGTRIRHLPPTIDLTAMCRP